MAKRPADGRKATIRNIAEGLMDIDGRTQVVRKHDVIFLPPGVEHSLTNTGLVDLVFLVVTSPVADDEPAA